MITHKDIHNKIRRLTAKDKKSLYQRVIKLSEECGELSEAFLGMEKCHGTKYKPEKGKYDVAEEAIDVVIVAMSIIEDLKIDANWIGNKFDQKLNKWKEVLELENE